MDFVTHGATRIAPGKESIPLVYILNIRTYSLFMVRNEMDKQKMIPPAKNIHRLSRPRLFICESLVNRVA